MAIRSSSNAKQKTTMSKREMILWSVLCLFGIVWYSTLGANKDADPASTIQQAEISGTVSMDAAAAAELDLFVPDAEQTWVLHVYETDEGRAYTLVSANMGEPDFAAVTKPGYEIGSQVRIQMKEEALSQVLSKVATGSVVQLRYYDRQGGRQTMPSTTEYAALVGELRKAGLNVQEE